MKNTIRVDSFGRFYLNGSTIPLSPSQTQALKEALCQTRIKK